MARYVCHEYPDLMQMETRVLDARPGAVLLEASPFYPGGGGQLPDRGLLRWAGGEAAVGGFEDHDGQFWVRLQSDAVVSGGVAAVVDPAFRQMMRELHTDLHILNALVFAAFDGALVTGVQMNDDGTARIDFDLPDADNDRLRALEPAVNDAIRQDLPVLENYVGLDRAREEKGLLRSRSVAPPPTEDGLVRIIEIAGLDRQACGGTHLAATGASRPVRILKIENKGRHNRRIRIGLDGR
ncbi:alanyl-tRNA editing protein [Ferrovibrio sp.]|uniref:alanyl-tRNA editing protein n=1 Tax=Ferrovibrio sp. TaxID=1917215 RepID=UPI00311DA19F